MDDKQALASIDGGEPRKITSIVLTPAPPRLGDICLEPPFPQAEVTFADDIESLSGFVRLDFVGAATLYMNGRSIEGRVKSVHRNRLVLDMVADRPD